MAPNPEESRNDRGFTKRELPGTGDECHYITDKEVVEEFEQVAQNRGEYDAALIAVSLV